MTTQERLTQLRAQRDEARSEVRELRTALAITASLLAGPEPVVPDCPDSDDLAALVSAVYHALGTHRINPHEPVLRRELSDALAQIRRRSAVAELFSGGPDTPCRTTWRAKIEHAAVECVEVPLGELRAALERDGVG